MDLLLPISIPNLPQPVTYRDRLMIVGSCFTEHIGSRLQELKFAVSQNPHGILFDPFSVADSLVSYTQGREYGEEDLFYHNELWQSWHHHSRFSGLDKGIVLQNINTAQREAHAFLKSAQWLIITLGSSFSYRLQDNNMPVANCHRAPGQWFRKHMMTIEEINTVLDNCIHQLFRFNPGFNILFTVSPVRHIRDGVVENNRSKARLIEVVHHLVNKFDRLFYFPAYELVIDVLRDYRFYDIDLVHPNYPATRFVLEQFMEHCVSEESRQLAAEVQQLVIASRHKSFNPETEAHKRFLQSQLEKARALQRQYPFLQLQAEIDYFSGHAGM